MTPARPTFAAVALIGVFAAAAAATDPEPVVIGQSHTLHSEVLGEDRTIMVGLPDDYERTTHAYPVLYLLDGPGHFMHVLGTTQVLARSGRMPFLIVVGIANTNRLRDMTPTSIAQAPGSGGADTFLQFIADEAIPFVDGRYRAHPYRVLAGHSMAGLTAVHALTSRPDAFDAYIAMSPSLQWDQELAQENAEAMFKSRSDLKTKLFLTLGDEAGMMLDAFDLFVSMLEDTAPSGLKWSHRIFEDDDHGTVVLRSMDEGLRTIFADFRMPRELAMEGDLAGIKKHMAAVKSTYGVPSPISENDMNNFGYMLLNQGQHDKAVEVFKMAIEAYPASANPHDSLGEAYEKAGKFELARDCYEKAVKRARETNDPVLETFEQNLKRMEQKLNADN